MNDYQDNHNLMSEKQAAERLGISRITLLRAREAGRLRFFRIGTRVLYCEQQLVDFLNSCERNARNGSDQNAKRKENKVSASRRSAASESNVDSADESTANQASLPLSVAS
jgi:excisionase family DNA binding protein